MVNRYKDNSYLQSKSSQIIIKMNEDEDKYQVFCKDKNELSVMDAINSINDNVDKSKIELIEKNEEEIAKEIALQYSYDQVITTFTKDFYQENIDREDSIIVELLDFIIDRAIIEGASDIHFEPEQDFLRIRYRVDGILQEKANLPLDIWERVNVRIKVLSKMSIAEHRQCFNGKIAYEFCNRKVDIRVSSQPVNWGENIVFRILDTKQKHINFSDIGLDPKSKELFQKAFSKSSGLFLISGPTGSGKTTTLYSILKEINCMEKSIVTLEDPIEYNIPMVRQTQIDYFGNVSFADGIRSILRQDPDVILIGEIRDEDSAKVAMRAAMTGHLVFSTIHAKNSKSIISRLNDFGISTSLLKENIVACASQVLVRAICLDCKEMRKITTYEKEIFKRYNLNAPDMVAKESSTGCKSCNNTGFKGRRLVAEITMPNNEGATNMKENALYLIKEQKLTFSEVNRVLDL